MKPLKPPVTVAGTVISGEKVGRTIGFPTANLNTGNKKLTIKKGIYLARCTLSKLTYYGLAYYGPRYIFNQKTNSYEVFLFDFNKKIYGKFLSSTLTHFIRPPVDTKSLSKLKQLMENDKKIGLRQLVVLVDKKQKNLGLMEKHLAHLKPGHLHQAISVFVFNLKGKLLIQKRSSHKTLWPLIWSNTVCSHPMLKESNLAAAQRRLKEEFGLSVKLKFHHQFIYQADYKDIGAEFESDSVFIGFSDKKPHPDTKEIADFKYVSPDWLKKDMRSFPKKYAPWFIKALKKLSSSDIVKP